MTFDIKIKFEDKVVQKSKIEDLDQFDSILDGLKEKFGGKKKIRK